MNRKIGWIINESPIEPLQAKIIKSDTRRVIAVGTLQAGNKENRNGRMYDTLDLIREIHAPRQNELLSTGNMFGEAGHPMSKDLVRQQTIDPVNKCVQFLEFWNEGDLIKAKFKGTNNALGETFDLDLRDGIKPAFSLRALGSVERTPNGNLVKNLKMITYDYVIYPSHPEAYTDGLVTESCRIDNKRSNFIKNGILKESMDATKSMVTTFTDIEVMNRLSRIQKESMTSYVKDQSKNFRLINEFFDLAYATSIDIVSPTKLAITEAGNGTIIMNIEDYISKELQDYTKNI